MFKKRKNHSMRRKKKLKQVVSDLRRRGGAYITKSGIRRKCRSLLKSMHPNEKQKQKSFFFFRMHGFGLSSSTRLATNKTKEVIY